jgi:hypothetical protein
MILEIDFNKIFDCAIYFGASENEYSFYFLDAFESLYPEVTNAYAKLLKDKKLMELP